MPKMRDIVILDTIKDGTDLFLKLTVAPELEEFFKQLSMTEFGKEEGLYTELSAKWFDKEGKGLKFYKNSPVLNEYIKKYLEGKIATSNGNFLNVSNAFGKGLFEEGSRVNVAILRVVGATKGVSLKTTDLIAFEEIKLYAEQLAIFVKEFYGNFILKKQVKAKIQFEV